METTIKREISFGNLFWKLLMGWRRWLILGIIFASVISGGKYAKDLSDYQEAADMTGDAKLGETEIDLTKEEEEAVKNAEEMQRQILKLQEYIEKSVWVNLDALHEKTLALQFYVDSGYTYNYMEDNEKDYLSELVVAYCNYVKSGELAKTIADKLNMNLEYGYMEELLSVNSSSGVFQIYVLHDDENVLKKMEPVIVEAVKGETKKIAEKIGMHTLELISGRIVARADTSLMNQQKAQKDLLESYRVQLTSQAAAMSEDQLKMFEKRLEEDVEIKEEENEQNIDFAKPSYRIRYAVLGFTAGVILAGMWIVMEVLFASGVQETRELSDLYGVRILGEFMEKENKKNLFGKADALILRLKNRNRKQMDESQQIHITSSNIELACEKNKINKIYLTGSRIEKIDEKWLTGLKELLLSAGIDVCIGEDIAYDGKAIKEMAEIGQVVFIEQIGLSLYSEVEKEVKTARENDIQILGSIIVDN